MTFEDAGTFFQHAGKDHGMTLDTNNLRLTALNVAIVSQLKQAHSLVCPLCLEGGSSNHREYSTHLGRHLEEIALAALPPGDSDEEEDADSDMDIASEGSQQDEHLASQPQLRRSNFKNVKLVQEAKHYETDALHEAVLAPRSYTRTPKSTPIPNLAAVHQADVAAAFLELTAKGGDRFQSVQCIYCRQVSAKNTSRQQEHLLECITYQTVMKESIPASDLRGKAVDSSNVSRKDQAPEFPTQYISSEATLAGTPIPPEIEWPDGQNPPEPRRARTISRFSTALSSSGAASTAVQDIAKSLARSKEGDIPEIVEMKCSDQTCDKIFNRMCDLAKHEKTHSRPFKCPEESCKYHEKGLATKIGRDHHVNECHSRNPLFYKCNFCGFRTKRERNCRQHQRKKHGWSDRIDAVSNTVNVTLEDQSSNRRPRRTAAPILGDAEYTPAAVKDTEGLRRSSTNTFDVAEDPGRPPIPLHSLSPHQGFEVNIVQPSDDTSKSGLPKLMMEDINSFLANHKAKAGHQKLTDEDLKQFGLTLTVPT